MTASCESVTDLMLPRVSGNSPSTLCRLLIEFVLVIEFVNKLPVRIFKHFYPFGLLMMMLICK